MSVSSQDDELVVRLEDGRTVHVPLEWFPKLRDATPAQLASYRLVGRGIGIHWPELDEACRCAPSCSPTWPSAGLRRTAGHGGGRGAARDDLLD